MIYGGMPPTGYWAGKPRPYRLLGGETPPLLATGYWAGKPRPYWLLATAPSHPEIIVGYLFFFDPEII